MSWDNRNRISVARGRNTAIANETTLQGNGQIIYNQDRHYITVGEPYNNNNRTPANNVPIRVRTVEGWCSETETFTDETGNSGINDTFQLSSTPTGYYLLTGDSTGVNLISNGQDINIKSENNSLNINTDGVIIDTNVQLTPNNYINANKFVVSSIDMSNNVSLTCPSGSNRLVITANNQQNYLYVTSNRIATPTPASTVNDDSLATTAFVHDLMGFKQCSIVNSADVNTAVGKIYRQGKVVFGRIYQSPKAYTQGSSIYSMELTQPTWLIKQLSGDDSIDYFTFTAESGKNLLNVAAMSGGEDPTQKKMYATFEGDNSIYTWQGELRIIYDIENRNFTPYLVVQNAAFLSGSLTGKLSTGVNASFGFDLTDSVVWN